MSVLARRHLRGSLLRASLRALALVVAPAGLPAIAAAQDAPLGRVAVAVSGGKQARTTATKLTEALLDAGLDVITGREYNATARRAGVKRSKFYTPDGVRKALGDAEVDAVVRGKLVRKKRRRILKLELIGADGTRHLNANHKIGKRGLSKRKLRRIAAAIRNKTPVGRGGELNRDEALADNQFDSESWDGGIDSSADGGDSRLTVDGDTAAFAEPAGGVSESGFTAAEQSDGAAHDDPTTDEDPSWNPLSYFGGAEENASADTGVRTKNDSPRRSSGWEPRTPTLAVRLLGGAGTRTYALEGGQPFHYTTKRPYPEAVVLVESFPLNTLGRFAEGLGIEASMSRGFVMSQLDLADAEGSGPQSTPVTRWHVDARYSVTALRSPYAPRVGLRAGFGAAQFALDQAVAQYTPVSTSGLRAGLELRQPVVPGYAEIDLAAVYVPAASVSSAEVSAHGSLQTASSMAVRVGVTGSATGEATGWTWGVYAEWMRSHAEFAGLPDNDGIGPSTGTEQYVAGVLGVGYAY